jgi:hypothetical protein
MRASGDRELQTQDNNACCVKNSNQRDLKPTLFIGKTVNKNNLQNMLVS